MFLSKEPPPLNSQNYKNKIENNQKYIKINISLIYFSHTKYLNYYFSSSTLHSGHFTFVDVILNVVNRKIQINFHTEYHIKISAKFQ